MPSQHHHYCKWQPNSYLHYLCCVRAISPCLPRWLPVLCRVKKIKYQFGWNWYLPVWRRSICLKALKQKGSGSRAWTVWQAWQRKMLVSGKDFVKTGEETLRFSFYNITWTSSTLSRGHPGRPKERLLAAFNGRCARIRKRMVAKCIVLLRNTNMP